ncbi:MULTISPECIES: SDR family oxidoreductase [unclassified Chryseobacterium]|uniref:SDR family oxidoreductase n=1 Tax=unclassified Chryseobacterium TaxID=2593645 RepID=UPI00285357D8|nr:SDR family oxidoreductase [Chryseobacterium sp. CFS7]MDR4894615.1 SDR family oxidoreductase [Chryseobacterium sp. CFS7]
MKKILLTGATGYIGKRMMSVITEQGYKVVCCCRDVSRFSRPAGINYDLIEVIEVDFLREETLKNIPEDISGAYYLMHSMSANGDYEESEKICAQNFISAIEKTECKHIIYLSGLVNQKELSKHLNSRFNVEKILIESKIPTTVLRAGIIIGSGSASFEIIRDLVEKLPIMITPKWLTTKCQPIGIANVLDFLIFTLFKKETYRKSFDIGCEDVLTYKEILLGFAKIRGLKRTIITLPVMTPKLSSYWLYFITSTTYSLASSLVGSMKIEVVCNNESLLEIKKITGVQPFSYEQALERTMAKIQANEILSSWKDSFISSRNDSSLKEFIEVPHFGCFKDVRSEKYDDREKCLDRIFGLGGKNGWYGQNLWKIRGYMDVLVGGPGLRRGRTHPVELHEGDALDFWRVLYADREEGKLILIAEMKLPGEAWLMFKLYKGKLWQKAVFRPKGLWGRLYWYSVLPFHGFIFKGMVIKLAAGH